MQIKSLQHPLVKHWVRLRKEKAYREETGRLLLVGETLISEYRGKVHAKIEESHVTPEIFHKIAGVEMPGGIAAEVDLPRPQDVSHCRYLLILDRVQDPGNVGTLLRSAWALGWEGAILTPDCADLFNDKALRASRGAALQMPFNILSEEEICNFAHTRKVALWVADAKGEPLSSLTFSPPLALVLGHEGQGVSAAIRTQGKLLAIPLCNQMDSLNVAAAGAILLHSLGRHP